jgi:hypothetical protein
MSGYWSYAGIGRGSHGGIERVGKSNASFPIRVSNPEGKGGNIARQIFDIRGGLTDAYRNQGYPRSETKASIGTSSWPFLCHINL